MLELILCFSLALKIENEQKRDLSAKQQQL